MTRWVIHHGVVLGRTVIPECDAVRLPSPANLILRDLRLADQVLEQLCTAGAVVLAISHVCRRVEVREMRGEGVHEKD